MTELVNFFQHKDTRKNKYRFLRDCGLSMQESRQLRDWTHRHIIQTLNVRLTDIKHDYTKDKVKKEEDKNAKMQKL
jgi:hypothetical protein